MLVVGCGDVGQRVLRRLPPRLLGGVAVLVRPASQHRDAGLWASWRRQGVRVLTGDLDVPHTLHRLGQGFDAVLHLAPPPLQGAVDTRTRHLLDALARGGAPARFVYVSTTGVYGDHGERWIDETATCHPKTERARRRLDAETQLRRYARRSGSSGSSGCNLAILRAPGIYAADREGHPRERLKAGRPVLRPEDDVFTHHIHADDLARACWRALFQASPLRTYNVTDDSRRRMGEHFDRAADVLGLPRPPRISRAEAEQQLSPVQMSFLNESRRLHNTRMKQELGLRLHYPLPEDGWVPKEPSA